MPLISIQPRGKGGGGPQGGGGGGPGRNRGGGGGPQGGGGGGPQGSRRGAGGRVQRRIVPGFGAMPTGSTVSNAVMNNYPTPSRGYINGNVRRFPARPTKRIMGDFSYARSTMVPVQPVKYPSATAFESPWKPAGDPGNKTAGEVFQDDMRGRLFETASGLVMAEDPSGTGEEYDFWVHGSSADPWAQWMQTNDRSSASTVLDSSLKEYGGGMGMGAFAMDGLASYSDFQSNGIMVLVTDIMDSINSITSNMSNLQQLNKDDLSNSLQAKGYPANMIDGFVNMAINFLPANVKDKITRPKSSTTTPPPTHQNTNKPPSSAPLGIPMWVYPLVGIGAFLAIKKFRKPRVQPA